MAYYPFIVTRDFDIAPERVAVIYHHRNGIDETALEEVIEMFTNRRLSPSRILVVCGRGQQESIKLQFEELEESTKDRLSVITDILIMPYGFYGEAELEHSIIIRGKDWIVSDGDLEEIAREGLKLLINETGVILHAPSGYVFRKPSTNSSRTFIRTGNMFRDPSALAITSHLLMRYLPADMDKLFIDSFTILPSAMAFVRERGAIARACSMDYSEPAIANFHSYSIDPDLRFPGHAKYTVLISASTSGKLAKKLIEQHGAKPDRLYHMLIFSSNLNLQDRAMYFEKTEPENGSVALPYRREINIPGEEFIASSGEPHPAKITKSHFSPLERKALALPYYQRALALNLAAPGQSAYSLINLAEVLEGENMLFDQWLTDEVEHAVPANVGWILAVDTNRSLGLANRISGMLASHLGRDLKVVSMNDVGREGMIPNDSADRTVLVVAANTGLGEELLSASRALRDARHKHRHYVVGHVFPESASQFERLQNNLRVSGRSRKYGWSCFLVSPLGQIERHNSWHIELELLTRGMLSPEAGSAPKNLRDALIARLEVLNAQGMEYDQLFLPRPDLRPLALRQESVLFSQSYEEISQVTVYLMISVALQRARDHVAHDGSALDEDMCFHGSPFIVSLLDPDMFSRFNDGVIQSAFLRACAPDELNYATHQILSRHVRDILVAAIGHPGSDAGEAVFEMLFALGTKRLRIKGEHYDEVVATIAENELLASFWALLNTEGAL